MISLGAVFSLAACVEAPDGLFVPVEAASIEELAPQPQPPGPAPGVSGPVQAAPEAGGQPSAEESEAGPMGALPVAPVAVAPGEPEGGAEGAAAGEEVPADQPPAPAMSPEVTPAAAPDGAFEPAPEAAPPEPEVCPSIVEPLLLDFEEPRNGPTQAVFGDFAGSLSGGTYQYPALSAEAAAADPDAVGLVSDVTEGDWHLSGRVSQASGFGLFLDCQLLDASRFAGVAFTLEGSVGIEGELLFIVASTGHTIAREWFVSLGDTGASASFGRCFPAGAEFDGTCEAPRVSLPLGPERREVLVLFGDLAGGSPQAGVDPAQITSLAWALPAPLAGEGPYAVDLRVDDIRFVEIAELEGSDLADTEPADTEPGDTEPADTELADAELANTAPGESEPADADPADSDPGAQ